MTARSMRGRKERVMRTLSALPVLAVFLLAACAGESDAVRARSHCGDRGLEVGSAQYNSCLQSQQVKTQRERSVRESFRYSP